MSHLRSIGATCASSVFLSAYAGCHTSPFHALQGFAANTAIGRGFPRLVRGFSFDSLSFHSSEICQREPLNTTPTFCEVL